ncbi:hypothetical protein JAAARDRAFT_40033, partial [Jaapia argillacea MUCL 33604]
MAIRTPYSTDRLFRLFCRKDDHYCLLVSSSRPVISEFNPIRGGRYLALHIRDHGEWT